MKRIIFIESLCAVILASATVAHAEWGDTYQATCRRIEQRGPILSAQCLNMYQRFQMSEVDLRTCGRGGVSNRNGILSCNIPLAFDRMRPRPAEPPAFAPDRGFNTRDRGFDRRQGGYDNRQDDYDNRQHGYDYRRRGYQSRDWDDWRNRDDEDRQWR